MEKSNTSLRKEAAEASERAGLAEKLAKEAVDSVKVAEANLKLEKEVSQLEIDSLKEALKCLESEKQSLVEQLENIAFEAMAKERHTLMKQFLAGEHKDWTPEIWIQDYESLVEESHELSNEGDQRKETQIAESDADKEKNLVLGESGECEGDHADA